MVGKVYLVGAGPGDPGLLTLRARELLEEADLVLYDGLVGRGVLRLIPRGTAKLRVAKGPRHRDRFPQSRINERLIAMAARGKRVVRLKGGDALLFSRGAEEAEELRSRGIPYEIVPGVPSALAAPAYAGIPLTERGIASSVAVVTGRESPSPHHPPVDWHRLARGAHTIVVLMGVATLGRIARRLRAAGLASGTPIAAIQWATTRQQRTTLFTLAEASNRSMLRRLGSPSVLVVGPTVRHAMRLGWSPHETRWTSPRFRRMISQGSRGRLRRDPLKEPPVGRGTRRRSAVVRPAVPAPRHPGRLGNGGKAPAQGTTIGPRGER